MKHELPKLNYSYDALEPYIDETTMTIHHTKHHAAYVNNLNAALEKYPELLEKSVEELLKTLKDIPEAIYWAVRNSGGGHYNHSLFWENLKKGGAPVPSGKLLELLDKDFGSFENFKENFSKVALSHFGSGWVWLVLDKVGGLKVLSTLNQDSPITDGLKPILGLDIWEHAYYLKYNNRRVDYIKEWWNVVNWEVVSQRLNS